MRTGAPVLSIQSDGVSLRGGERIPAGRIVIATDGAEAERLVGLRGADTLAVRAPRRWHGVTCVYFAASEPPVEEPVLVLDGEGRGPVNHLCVPTQIAPEYGPPGAALVCASILAAPTSPEEESELLAAVRGQLADWFGEQASRWTHLRTYVLPQALPDQAPGRHDSGPHSPWVGAGLLVCGGHREMGSLQGALRSGRRAAEALLEESVSPRARASRELAHDPVLDPVRVPPLLGDDEGPLHQHAVVEMIPAGEPRGPAPPQLLRPRHRIPFLHRDRGEVAVQRHQAVAVIHDHGVPVNAEVLREHDDAVVGRGNRHVRVSAMSTPRWTCWSTDLPP